MQKAQAAVPWSRLTIELSGLQPISRDAHFFFSTIVPQAPSLRGVRLALSLAFKDIGSDTTREQLHG